MDQLGRAAQTHPAGTADEGTFDQDGVLDHGGQDRLVIGIEQAALGRVGALDAQRPARGHAGGGGLRLTELAGALLGSGSGTYSIDSRARLEEGRSARLRAVVRTGGGAVPGTAYSVLRWEEGASPR